MKEYFKLQYHEFKNNWKQIATRFIIYILGVYLFGMGIALYLNTQVGASHIDITNFAFIAILKGLKDDGSLSDLSIYSTVLLIFYLAMLVVVISLRFTNAYLNYRKNHDKIIFLKATINSVLDLIPTFVWAYFVQLNQLYIPVEQIGNLKVLARTWIFIGGFLLYCVGIALTVYANMLFGPYNGLSQELHLLTNWNYKLCRVLVDVILMLIGLITFLATPLFDWNLKGQWLSLYFGFGTIFMTFIAGPVIGFMLHSMNKFIKIKYLLIKIFNFNKRFNSIWIK